MRYAISLINNIYIYNKKFNFIQIWKLYDTYEYHRVVTNTQNFVANQISAIYLHTIKDRLYCGDKIDIKNIHYTLLNCYKVLCSTLWPIIPFLVEESWQYYDPKRAFHQQNFTADPAWKDAEAEKIVGVALEIKRIVNQKAGSTNSFNLAVEISYNKNNEEMQMLRLLQEDKAEVSSNISELCELLQVQRVSLQPSNDVDFSDINVQKLELTLCARCRRFAVDNVGCVCERCTLVLANR